MGKKNAEVVLCPNGCGCRVPQAIIDAVIAERGEPKTPLDKYRVLLEAKIRGTRSGAAPPSEHGGLWENGFVAGLEQARNILNYVTGVPPSIKVKTNDNFK